MDLDTFLTTLYVLVDDWYKEYLAAPMQRQRGAPVKMSDSEVLTVALAGQWRVGVPWQSERGVVRYMQRHGRGWFPQMLERSAFNLRVRNLWTAFVQLQQLVAHLLHRSDEVYCCVDCVPLPVCSLAQAARTHCHWLWLSQRGHGGNHGGWFYGDKLLLVVSPEGVVSGWLVGSGGVNDRWLMEGLLSTRAGTPCLVGPTPDTHASKWRRSEEPNGYLRGWQAAGEWSACPYVADRNFRSPRWQEHWQADYGAVIVTKPARYDRSQWSIAAQRWLSGLRQIVDTVFARLVKGFHLQQLQAHSYWGQLTRIAACLAAYNLGLYLNHLLERPLGALETLLC
jgi:hypothetical protein